MAALKASIQESIEHQRELQWLKEGVPQTDIAASRQTGMDARDIRTFREFSLRGLLFVVRCPKTSARAMHGMFGPKIMAEKEKTGSSGLVVSAKHGIMVSDYDLMSVWRTPPGGPPQKIFISAADGASRGKWTIEAQMVVVELNAQLVSRIQHGCQDDFQSPMNPGVKAVDHFAAFHRGRLQHFAGPAGCAAFYALNHLPWLYDAQGKYTGAG